jgi:hypothetical protein
MPCSKDYIFLGHRGDYRRAEQDELLDGAQSFGARQM